MASACSLIQRVHKLAIIWTDAGWRSGLRQGVAASVEHRHVAFDHDFRSVIDVGANRGQFALFATRRFPGAAVYCFEPLPEARKQLAKVLAGRPSVSLFDLALGSEAADKDLRISARDDSSSLLAIGRQAAEFPGTHEVDRVPVRTARLDDVLAVQELWRPSLLKIDVQGFELEVLRGAGSLLHAVDEIVVECSFVELYEGQALADEVVCFLGSSGFRLRGISSLAQDSRRRCLQADFHFTA